MAYTPPMPMKLIPINADNWRHVAALEVTPEQRAFVAEPAYYLCLCNYGELWNPLAVDVDGKIVGFMMWAVDPDDGSCWLGGILIDRRQQGAGLRPAGGGRGYRVPARSDRGATVRPLLPAGKPRRPAPILFHRFRGDRGG